jgi:hypothetical protein
VDELMSESNGKPPVIEGPGRYVIYSAPDGGWVVARAVDICEGCQECGCGEQADAIQIPAMVIALASRQGFSLGKAKEMLKAAAGRG